MRKNKHNESFRPSIAERMRAWMAAALAESDRTASMSADEFLKDFRTKDPDALFPSMADDSWLTAAEEAALGNWAKFAREGDATIKRTVDSSRWMRIVRSAYVAMDRERLSPGSTTVDAEAFAAKVLHRAKINAQDTKLPLLHYCPCYLFETQHLNAFRVGPVELIPGRDLVSRLTSAAGQEPKWMRAYQALSGSEEAKASSYEEYRARDVQRMVSFPWIAIVSTDGYESGMAQQRADDMARLAVAGLGLWMTPGQCASMSLVHEWRGPLHRSRMFQVPGRDILVGHALNRSQVSADVSHIQKLLTEQGPYFTWLGESIQEGFASTPGSGGNLREAWLNALYWYYCGCVEPSDPRATICFTSALESLCNKIGKEAITTMLERLFGKERGEIVVHTEHWSLGYSVQQIYGVGRSESVHGGRFVLLHEYRQIRDLAAVITRLALLYFQEKLLKYELKYKRVNAADSKSAFLRWLEAN